MARLLRDPGRPLDPALRDRYAPLYGFDLSRVRLHSDEGSAASARGLGARAFAVGRHIFMGDGVREGTAAGERTIAHELAHVVQQRGAEAAVDRPLDVADPSVEHTARRAGAAAFAGHFAPPFLLGTAPPQLAMDGPGELEEGDSAMSAPFGLHVDRFEEIFYDFDYRPAQPGHLSKWIRVSYGDGTLIDINIDEISEATLSSDEMLAAMRGATIGRGRRIWPTVLNRQTAPRLYAARRSVLEAMDEFNLSFMLATMPAVFFIITMPIGMAGGRGGPPRAVRRPAPRPRLGGRTGSTPPPTTTTQPPAAGAAATESAEEIGAAIGRSVAGRTTGKMAGIVEGVTARGLGQEAAATATEAAVRTMGLRVGPRTLLPNGNIVVTSVQLGSRQPVLVVRPDGSVFRATADLVLEGLEVLVRNVTPL